MKNLRFLAHIPTPNLCLHPPFPDKTDDSLSNMFICVETPVKPPCHHPSKRDHQTWLRFSCFWFPIFRPPGSFPKALIPGARLGRAEASAASLTCTRRSAAEAATTAKRRRGRGRARRSSRSSTPSSMKAQPWGFGGLGIGLEGVGDWGVGGLGRVGSKVCDSCLK